MYLIFRAAEEQRNQLQNDLNARQKIEAAAAYSEAKHRLVFDSVLDGIITINSAGTVEAMSRSAEEMFGYGAEQAIGRNVTMLMPGDLARNHDNFVANYHGSGASIVVRARRDFLEKSRTAPPSP